MAFAKQMTEGSSLLPPLSRGGRPAGSEGLWEPGNALFWRPAQNPLRPAPALTARRGFRARTANVRGPRPRFARRYKLRSCARCAHLLVPKGFGCRPPLYVECSEERGSPEEGMPYRRFAPPPHCGGEAFGLYAHNPAGAALRRPPKPSHPVKRPIPFHTKRRPFGLLFMGSPQLSPPAVLVQHTGHCFSPAASAFTRMPWVALSMPEQVA